MRNKLIGLILLWIELLMISGTPVIWKPPRPEMPELIITEVYSAPFIAGASYIEIYNPLSSNISLEGWEIENKEGNCHFPAGYTISNVTHIVIAYKAISYYHEFGIWPNFEIKDTTDMVPDMEGDEINIDYADYIILKHNGGVVDSVVYGNSEVPPTIMWNGSPSAYASTGYSLQRDYNQSMGDLYIDTNTRNDWIVEIPSPGAHSNTSYFKPVAISDYMDIAVFVGPDSAYSFLNSIINNATKSIYFEIYVANHKELADALVSAMNAGVVVKGILESNTENWSVFEEDDEIYNNQQVLFAKKIAENPNGDIRWAIRYFEYTHASMMIIDNKTVVIMTDTFSQEGAPVENTRGHRTWGVAIDNRKIAAKFLAVFDRDFMFSSPFNLSECVSPAASLSSNTTPGNYSPSYQWKWYYHILATVYRIAGPSSIINAYTELIESAESALYVDAYNLEYSWSGALSPLISAICDVSDRGVITRVLMDNSSSKNAYDNIKRHGGAVCWTNISNSGISSHHANGIIVDNYSVLLGSIEFSEESMCHNREISVRIDSTEVAEFFASVLLEDIPRPMVSKISFPRLASYNAPVNVSFTIEGVGKGDEVSLIYNTSTGSWETATERSRGVYFGEIPAFPWNTTVELKIKTRLPDKGEVYYIPIGEYVVADFDPPKIHASHEYVSIVYNVSEPPNASGVRSIVIKWRVNNSCWREITLPMPFGDVTLSGMSPGSVVEYIIEARDNANNTNTWHEYFLIAPPGHDSLSPYIQDITYPREVYSGREINFSVLLFVPKGCIKVYMEYRVNNGPWIRLTMKRTSGDMFYGNYTVVLPAQPASSNVEWRIVVEETDDNLVECKRGTYTVLPSSPIEIRVLGIPVWVLGIIVGVVGGFTYLSVRIYRMIQSRINVISIPVDLEKPKKTAKEHREIKRELTIRENLPEAATEISHLIYSRYRIPVAVAIYEMKKPLYVPRAIKRTNLTLDVIPEYISVIDEDTVAWRIGNLVLVIRGKHISKRYNIVEGIYGEILKILHSRNLTN